MTSAPTGGGTGQRAPWVLAALVLLGLLALTFGPWLRGQETLYDGDLRYLQMPLWNVARASLEQGELPLWVPEIRGGFPLHAYGELGLFYPPNAVLLRLPPRLGVPLSLALHVLLGALGLGLWIRARGGSAAAWLVSASSFWFGGFLLARLGWVNAIAVAAWWPWLLWALDRPGPLLSLGRVALAGGFGALMLLAGRPQLAVPAAIGAGLVAFARLGGIRRGNGSAGPAGGDRRREPPSGEPASWLRGAMGVVVVLAAAGVLALGLAGPQVLPTLELVQRSDRAGGVEGEKAEARQGDRLQAETARYLALPATTPGSRRLAGETRAYPGALALLLAVAALGTWHRRPGRATLAFALLTAAGLLLATGALAPIFSHVPVLRSFRTPSRFLVLYALGVAGLAGIGVDGLTGRRWRWAIALLVACELGFVARAELPFGPPAPLAARPLAARTLLDLPRTTPDGVTARVYAPNAPALELDHLPANADTAAQTRFVETAEHLGSNLAVRYGLRDVSGYGDLAPRRYDALLRAASPRVLRLLAVRYVTLGASAAQPAGFRPVAMLPDRTTIYEVEGAGPRAFLVHDVQVERDEARSLRLVLDPRLDLTRQAVVDRPPPLPAVPRAAPAARDRVRWLRDDAQRAALHVELARPGLLVIADAWGPGWQATVDGVAATLVRADHALRGVALPAGVHRVELRYRPASLWWGGWLSAGCVALLALAAVGGWWWRRRRAEEGSGEAEGTGHEGVGGVDALPAAPGRSHGLASPSRGSPEGRLEEGGSGENGGRPGRLLAWGALVAGVTVVCALLHARIFQGFGEQSFDTAVSVQSHYLALHGGGASGITGLSWLGDHVAPLLFLELPVFAVWPSALSLQILKCFALALALPGTWFLVRALAGARAATGAVVLVLAGPLFWTAALADHHTETLGAALLPWLLLAYERRRIGWFAAIAVAVALGKENLPLVVGGVAVLALFDRRRPGWWLGTGLAAGVWFLVAVLWIQPHAAGGAAPKAFLYRHLASIDGWRAILADPRLWGWLTTLGLLGGALSLLAPSGLWPAVPLLLQNGLSSNPASRMLDFHYVAPLLFTLVYAAARGVRRLGPRPRRLVFYVLLAVQLGGSWFLGPWGRVLRARPSGADQALVAAVPRGAPAWASVSTAARLAARERLYLVEALTTGRFAGNDRPFDLDRVARAGWPRHGLIDVRDRDVLVMPPGLEAVDAVGDRVRLAAVGAPLVAKLDDPSSLGPATGRVAGLVFHAGQEGKYAIEVGSPIPNLLHFTLVSEGGVEVDRQVHRPLYGLARKPGVYRTRYHPPALEAAPPGRYRVVATFPGRAESAVVTTFDRGAP